QGAPDPDPAHREGRRRGAESPQGRPRAGPWRRARARPGRESARAPCARARDRIRVARGDLRAAERRAETMATRSRGGSNNVSTTETATKRVAYYKGCLASLSAKELDTSTKALAPRVGIELVELESVTCCGAGDIHEAEPDYYVHLNARILAYAEATGCDTLLTVCNVCTLNLRQANHALQGDEKLLVRVNENLQRVGVPPYSGKVEVRHLLWEIAEGPGYELLLQAAHKG